MNLEILGGKPTKQKKTAKNSDRKKRQALSDLDKNHGKSAEAGESASSAAVEEPTRTVQPPVADVNDEIVPNGLWRIIQASREHPQHFKLTS